MVNDIFETIGSAISGVIDNMGSVFQNITSLFYTPGTEGGSGSFTFLGILLLITSGVALVYFAFKLIRGLLSRLHS